jgi:hypothetical protein
LQEEERAKIEKDNEAKLEARLEEERRRLKEDAERDRAALLSKFNDSGAVRNNLTHLLTLILPTVTGRL